MYAPLQILKPLISSVLPSTWANLVDFPFKNLNDLHPRIYDLCPLFESPHGSLGILLLEFDPEPSLLVMPYHLSRYQEGPCLASLHPWTLADATHDSRFYWAWRRALHRCNPIPTLRGGSFEQKYIKGEPETFCKPLESSPVECQVSLRHQEILKIRKVINSDPSNLFEFQVMEYLMEQTIFTSYPEVISVHTYTFQNNKYHLALTTRQFEPLTYRNNLGPQSASAFPLSQSEIEAMARATGEFHLAMAKARSPFLCPEPLKGVCLSKWANGCSQRIKSIQYKIRSLEKVHPYKTLSDLEKTLWEPCLNFIRDQPHLGLLIRTHSRLRLESFVLNRNNLILTGFCNPIVQDQFLSEKQPALFDVAELLISIKSILHNDDEDTNFKNPDLIGHGSGATIPTIANHKDKNEFSLHLNDAFLRIYNSTLAEDIHASELSPREPQGALAMLTINLLICAFRRMEESLCNPSLVDLRVAKIANDALKNMRVY